MLCLRCVSRRAVTFDVIDLESGMCRSAGERPIPQGGDQERPRLRGEGEISAHLCCKQAASERCRAPSDWTEIPHDELEQDSVVLGEIERILGSSWAIVSELDPTLLVDFCGVIAALLWTEAERTYGDVMLGIPRYTEVLLWFSAVLRYTTCATSVPVVTHIKA